MRVVVVGRFALTRKALCGLLANLPAHRVVADVDDAENCAELLHKVRAEALLMDAPCSADTIERVLRLRRLFPSATLLLLVDGCDAEFERQAVKAGVRGCISKASEPEVLARALTVIEQGEFWMSRGVTSLVLGRLHQQPRPLEPEPEVLSRREWEILSLIARGKVNKEIGTCLSISSNTVKAHLSSIYRKLGVSTRLEAALHFFQQVHAKNPAIPRGTPDPLASEDDAAALHRILT